MVCSGEAPSARHPASGLRSTWQPPGPRRLPPSKCLVLLCSVFSLFTGVSLFPANFFSSVPSPSAPVQPHSAQVWCCLCTGSRCMENSMLKQQPLVLGMGPRRPFSITCQIKFVSLSALIPSFPAHTSPAILLLSQDYTIFFH